MAEEGYEQMAREAIAKNPEEREPWEVSYLESLEEMRQEEREARHPIAWAIMIIVLGVTLIAPAMGICWVFYQLTIRLWSIYGDSIINILT